MEDNPDLQPLDSFEDEIDNNDDKNEYDDGDEDDKEDNEDEQDRREARVKPKKRPKQFQEPASDNDPDEAFTDDGSADEEDAWTRNLSKIRMHKFQGPKQGPTFDGRAFTAVQFFFTFFPPTIISKMVDWTNARIRGINKGATTLEEL